MKIKWANILAIIALICLITFFVKLNRKIDYVSVDLHLPHYLNDPVYGLMFLGLICVTVVVIVRNLTKK